jgi:ribosomal protein S27AE
MSILNKLYHAKRAVRGAGRRLAGWSTDDVAKLLKRQEQPKHSHPSITCPRCGATSYNANDILEGYCGRCHDWTTRKVC